MSETPCVFTLEQVSYTPEVTWTALSVSNWSVHANFGHLLEKPNILPSIWNLWPVLMLLVWEPHFEYQGMRRLESEGLSNSDFCK